MTIEEAVDLATTTPAVNDSDSPRSALERLEDAIAAADAARERGLAAAKAEYAREVKLRLENHLAGLDAVFEELDNSGLELPFDLAKMYRWLATLREKVRALDDEWISELTGETQA